VFDIEDISKHVAGKTVVLVDDIMTSRSTMQQSMNALRIFDPNKIIGLTLFKS
jgi:hypoxanthine-guanine phosphoribosyltransferase